MGARLPSEVVEVVVVVLQVAGDGLDAAVGHDQVLCGQVGQLCGDDQVQPGARTACLRRIARASSGMSSRLS